MSQSRYTGLADSSPPGDEHAAPAAAGTSHDARQGPSRSEARVTEIAAYAQFRALREAWNGLAGLGRTPSVFLRHEWFDAVWQWPQPHTCPLVLAFLESEALVGVLPLALRRRTVAGVGLRVLEPLQVPDTQEFGLIAEPDRMESLIAVFAGWLSRNRRRWDLLDLKGLPAARGGRAPFIAGLGEAGIPSGARVDEINLSIDVSQPWETYYGGLSRRLKKGNNLIRNRLEKAAHVGLHCYHTPEATGEGLERAVAVSAQSWKAQLGLSLDCPGPRAFIERLTAHAAPAGWLSLWVLELDGEAVAIEYQLVYQGRVHALRGDFDPAYEHLSPGSYLHHSQLRSLFDEPDALTYLMGPGANAYKVRWSEDGERLESLRAWSPSWRGAALRVADRRLRPPARRLRSALTRRSRSDTA